MSDPNELVIAHQAESSSEAELIRAILEGAGLMAFVPNQNMPIQGIDLTPFDGEYSFSGCEVVVPRRHLEEAKRVLEEARAAGRLEWPDEAQGSPEEASGPEGAS